LLQAWITTSYSPITVVFYLWKGEEEERRRGGEEGRMMMIGRVS